MDAKTKANGTHCGRVFKTLAQQRLRESADLYAEIYETDHATQQWTDAALSGWLTYDRLGRRKEDRP